MERCVWTRFVAWQYSLSGQCYYSSTDHIRLHAYTRCDVFSCSFFRCRVSCIHFSLIRVDLFWFHQSSKNTFKMVCFIIILVGIFGVHACILAIINCFRRPSVPRKSESQESTELDMVLPSVKWSKRWKSPSTPNTRAPSVERYEFLVSVNRLNVVCFLFLVSRTPWSEHVSVSGVARDARKQWPVVPMFMQQPLLPPFDLPSVVWPTPRKTKEFCMKTSFSDLNKRNVILVTNSSLWLSFLFYSCIIIMQVNQVVGIFCVKSALNCNLLHHPFANNQNQTRIIYFDGHSLDGAVFVSNSFVQLILKCFPLILLSPQCCWPHSSQPASISVHMFINNCSMTLNSEPQM